MGLRCARWLGYRRVAVAVGLLGLLVSPTQAQTPGKGSKNAVTAHAARDVGSRNFLVHTDLSDREAKDLVARLEAMLREISTYWGRPMQGTIECYVVRDFENFPLATMDPRGISGIRMAEGVTLVRTATAGKRRMAKAVVYANTRPEVVLHEAVHAYCHHTFGRIGPVWYSEGMAEMGHYWKRGDSAIRVDQRESRFLRENLPTSLVDTLSASQVSGDSWQNYASRWALCHFLVHDPNYSSKFLTMGQGFLAGKDVSFDQTYGATARELSFEYLFFLRHISPGYRVDLCAWDWNKKFAVLLPGKMVTATISAGRGWQPTGLTVTAGGQYDYSATGNWRVANQPKAVNASGDSHGRGRLVGVLMKDYQLSNEIEMSERGWLQMTASGDLYLRCRNDWNELTSDVGRIAVRLNLQGGGLALRKAVVPPAAGAKAVRIN